MKRYLLSMLLVCLLLVATAAPAFAQGQGSRPTIGGPPPGGNEANSKSFENPGAENRAVPKTGGQAPRFQ
jgi:hypothetical protein